MNKFEGLEEEIVKKIKGKTETHIRELYGIKNASKDLICRKLKKLRKAKIIERIKPGVYKIGATSKTTEMPSTPKGNITVLGKVEGGVSNLNNEMYLEIDEFIKLNNLLKEQHLELMMTTDVETEKDFLELRRIN